MLAGIILSYNTPHLTNAIYEQLNPYCDKNFRLYVFDNGSDVDKISPYTNISVKKNLRMSKGFNTAVQYVCERHKRPDYIWLMSNDIVLTDGCPQKFLWAFETYPKAGLIHPALTKDSVTSWEHMVGGDVIENTMKMVWMADIIAPVIPTKLFLKLGGFNPLLTRGWGIDFEISYDLYKKNRPVYIYDGVRIKHLLGGTYRTGMGGELAEIRDAEAANEVDRVLGKRFGAGWADKIYRHNFSKITGLQ